MNETIEDHQHPDIKHIAFVGGPYVDKVVTRGERKAGATNNFFVDTKADHNGTVKIVRTKFKQLLTANAFIKMLRENPEVRMEEVEELSRAQILLQGRSPEDDRRLRIHNEDIMLAQLKEAFADGSDRDQLFKILRFHLRDVKVKWKDRIKSVPYYTEIE